MQELEKPPVFIASDSKRTWSESTPNESRCQTSKRVYRATGVANAHAGGRTEYLQGPKCFFSLDFFKGYWQFLLATESQELYSFSTDDGIYTPTRVLMGGSDSVAYCQSFVQNLFDPLLYNGLLVWIDDLLGYAQTDEELLFLLHNVLTICQKANLELNPNKYIFWKREMLWCSAEIHQDYLG
uniref:Uncharacterized protein AlNc14C386G11262 n=1 Tax=Albugo laibachii Nc14 TaxID=890382 RepID=F0WYJ9_9STRA|nr:hypothetical protein TcasGA2_TC016174 [Albugo laibachii Nc14]|eukprot:CCA26557.1 hypothetical protein TcasGA2_TC016174 [Albugo laibachii Nc14]